MGNVGYTASSGKDQYYLAFHIWDSSEWLSVYMGSSQLIYVAKLWVYPQKLAIIHSYGAVFHS